MSLALKRTELQALAEAKINDATLLLQNQRYGNAFYLAGYAVELGLKAKIALQMIPHAIPDKAFINKIYSHDFKTLVGLAGLGEELRDEEKRNATFATYWGIAGQWCEASRYEATEAHTAQFMVQAVGDPKDGIMRWIRQHW